MEEIKITTEDNEKIAINKYATGKKVVTIIAPGWYMTKDSKIFRQISETFSKYSDIITIDFRGHGRSSGFYTFTSREIKDISAVLEYAKTRYNKIYLMGFSLGGSLVLIAGSRFDFIDKIVTVSPPTCFEKIENKIWKKEAWINTIKKCEIKRWLSIRPSIIIRNKIKPIDIVNKIKCPTLFIAGEKDPTVCFWHTEALFNKAICTKKYELFENCCHAEDLFLEDKEHFIKLCTQWLYRDI